MRSLPNDKWEKEEAERLKVEPWMLEYLKTNPSYTCWGPGEDYMSTREGGWSQAQEHDTWAEFGPYGLDDLNEVVNFYFEVTRASKKCPDCENGYSLKAAVINDQWYGTAPFDPVAYGARPLAREDYADEVERQFSRTDVYRPTVSREAYVEHLYNHHKGQWAHHLIQADVDALVEAGRLHDLTHKWIQGEGWVVDPEKPPVTPEMVNKWSLSGMGHDSINHSICVRARCEREGVPVECATCEGHAYVHTSPTSRLGVVLWVLHPRKGCSRGVRVRNLSQDDARAAVKYLRAAARRNAKRFSKLPCPDDLTDLLTTSNQ